MLLHLLTAAAIFVHATLGCCAHETHDVRVEKNEPSDCGCCCHHHHPEQSHSEQSDPAEESPEPVPHECNHADCSWPAPEARTDIDLLTLDLTGIVPSTSTLSLASILGSLHGNEFNFSGLSPNHSLHTLSVRAHLAHCILLI